MRCLRCPQQGRQDRWNGTRRGLGERRTDQAIRSWFPRPARDDLVEPGAASGPPYRPTVPRCGARLGAARAGPSCRAWTTPRSSASASGSGASSVAAGKMAGKRPLIAAMVMELVNPAARRPRLAGCTQAAYSCASHPAASRRARRARSPSATAGSAASSRASSRANGALASARGAKRVGAFSP